MYICSSLKSHLLVLRIYCLQTLHVSVVGGPVHGCPARPVLGERLRAVLQQRLHAVGVVAEHGEHQRGTAELKQEVIQCG